MPTLRDLMSEVIREEITDQVFYKKTKEPMELDTHAISDKLMEAFKIDLKEEGEED